MRIYLSNQQDITKARVYPVGKCEEAFINNKQIMFGDLPEPDRTDLAMTLDTIIASEARSGNIIDHYELFVVYNEQRYFGLKSRKMFVPLETQDRLITSPVMKEDVVEEEIPRIKDFL